MRSASSGDEEGKPAVARARPRPETQDEGQGQGQAILRYRKQLGDLS